MASFAVGTVPLPIETTFSTPSCGDRDDEEFAEGDQFDLEDGSCRSSTASTTFVRKLYDMVDKENDEIICWLPDGLSFEVLLQNFTLCLACICNNKLVTIP
jgi:hypothetical protein